MGNIRLGVPEELVLRLRNAFGVSTFVETGTYKAGSTMWAAGQFDQVYTIEGYERYYKHNVSAHGGTPNVRFIFGDSRVKLPEVLAQLKEPAVVWLDAHFLGNMEESAHSAGECPLREELAALRSCGVQHYILIDDVHLFTGDLPRLSDRTLWPSLREVFQMMPEGYFTTTFEDAIISVPEYALPVVEQHMAQPERPWVLVPTCNEYVKLAPGFAYFFNKFWSNRQPVTVMRYEIRPPKQPANFTRPCIGKEKDFSWSSGLYAYLMTQAHEHVLLMLDDYYLDKPVDQERIANLWKLCQENPEIEKIDLSGDLGKRDNLRVNYGLFQARPTDQYRGSLQAAIWRVDYLLGELSKADLTPWQFEKRACKDGLIFGVQEPALSYVNACGGMGHKPGELDLKKIPVWMYAEMHGARLI